ncbi:hypothetical protein LCGC14_0248700 [marine sediment metagenome]|uniref:Uncharacterized protein n=1 Tax=marine sediment metagenome TaxID=412755 RepID=A0A0F9X9N9_9ZZZZ
MRDKEQIEQTEQDREWWVEVGFLIDPKAKLCGWDHRYKAAFGNPTQFTVCGAAARVLMRQQDKLKQFRKKILEVRTIVV